MSDPTPKTPSDPTRKVLEEAVAVLQDEAVREFQHGILDQTADHEPLPACPKCGGSGGGPDPVLKCSECDGAGVQDK